jgi:hypothetical protein
MRWVDVPFEIDGDTMHTQRTEWPQNCACCGGAADGRTEGIDGTLEISRGPGGVESSFNVSFPVPFCGECGGHAGVVLPIQFSAGVAAFLIWVLIGWILFLADMAYDVMGMVLFLGSAVLLAALAYWVSRRLIDVLSEAKMRRAASRRALQWMSSRMTGTGASSSIATTTRRRSPHTTGSSCFRPEPEMPLDPCVESVMG